MIQKEKTLEKFGVNTDNLLDGSHKRIIIKCDYCGDDTENTYKNYMISKKNTVINKDCCMKCRGLKAKECNAARDRTEAVQKGNKQREETCLEKYGKKHANQTLEIRDKMAESLRNRTPEEKEISNIKRKQTFLDKYGKTFGEMLKDIFLEKYGVNYCPLAHSPDANKKREDTMLKLYGVKNIFELPEIQEQIKKTCLERYGFEYHMQRDEFRELMSKEGFGWNTEESRKKIKETNLKTYGFEYATQNKEIQDKIIKTKIERGFINFVEGKTDQQWADETGISRTYANVLLRKYGSQALLNFERGRTSIETIIKYILDNNNIKYKEQEIFVNDDKTGHKRADFVIEDTNLIIEANGTFWHSENIRGKTYHKEKREFYLKGGYNCLFFNEDEIMFKSQIVESIILNKLGLTKNKIAARKCQIREIEPSISREFYTENHLMGKSSGRTFGLFYKDKLVSCIQLRKKQDGYEIARFCNLLNYSVIGGFSRLLSCAVKELNAKKIITFIDLRYGSGNYLPILGFEKQTEYLSFRWVGYIETFHRMQFPGNTGLAKGYKKIWDCGQAKWVKYINSKSSI